MCNSQLIPAEAPITFKMGDVDVFEQDGQFWFRIQDVAKCLEYSQPSNWDRWFRTGDTLFHQIEGTFGRVRHSRTWMQPPKNFLESLLTFSENSLYSSQVDCVAAINRNLQP